MIEVANSELVDKLTILEIKREHGLAVDTELEILNQAAQTIFDRHSYIQHPRAILKTINAELWKIEDFKRACERDQQFNDEFVAHARLVYLLNDERARIKKLIDTLTESKITEHKSHERN